VGVIGRHTAAKEALCPRSIRAPTSPRSCRPCILLQLVERCVICASSSCVALAHADADATGEHRPCSSWPGDFGKQPLIEIVGEDRVISEAGLDAPGVHVAQDIGNGVVDLDSLKSPLLLSGST